MNILCRNKKIFSRYIIMFCIITFSLFGIVTIPAIYSGYQRIQLDNCYLKKGNYDVRVTNQNSFDIEGMNITGEIKKPYYGIYACNKQDMENYFADVLIEGNWPASVNEVVVNKNLTFEDRAYVDGTLKVGDKIEIELYSIDEPGDYEIRTFIVSGFYEANVDSFKDEVRDDVFVFKDYDCRTNVYFYSFDDISLEILNDVKGFCDTHMNVCEMNEDVYTGYYNAYGSNFITQIKYGVVGLVSLFVIMSVFICIVNDIYILDEERIRNKQIYSCGGNVSTIVAIYIYRFLGIMLSAAITGVLISVFVLRAVGKYLRHIWVIYRSSVDIRDFKVEYFICGIIIIIITNILFCLYMVIRDIKDKKRNKRTYKKELKKFTDIALINIRNNIGITILFIVSLSIFVVGVSFELPIKKKIQENIEYVNGKGFGNDVTLDGDGKDITDNLNRIEGVKKVYTSYGGMIGYTELKDEYFVEQAKHTQNYNTLVGKDVSIYVLPLTEDKYSELCKYNDLPDYKEMLQNKECLTYSQFISQEDAGVYDAFAFNEQTISLHGFEDESKKIEVKPIKNISMPNNSREVGIIMATVYVPESIYLEAFAKGDYTYNIYLDYESPYTKEAVAAIKEFEKRGYMVTEHSNDLLEQRDRYLMHRLIANLIFVLLIMQGGVGIYTTISLDKIAKKEKNRQYYVSGMSKSMLNQILLTEYVHKLLDIIIVSIIAVSVVYNSKLIIDIYKTYHIGINTCYTYMITMAVGAVFLALGVVLSSNSDHA